MNNLHNLPASLLATSVPIGYSTYQRPYWLLYWLLLPLTRFAVLFIQENEAIAKKLALPFAKPLIHALPAKGHNFFVNLTIARG